MDKAWLFGKKGGTAGRSKRISLKILKVIPVYIPMHALKIDSQN